MDPVWWLILPAAFLGGALNAVAGGGSFLTLPALLWAGVPPVAANATGTLSLLPGYLASCAGYRRELRRVWQDWPLPGILLLTVAGGGLGAALLLLTSDVLFRALVPWLLGLATVLFLLAPRLLGVTRRLPWGALAVALLLVSVYGGYFNGGLGIMLLALFVLAGPGDLHQANALKNVCSALLTLMAVLAYALGGALVWRLGVPMMLAGALGGYVGAAWGRHLPVAVLRGLVIFTGASMTLWFAVT
ncbi:sulfite exporter TauE/SafE family protein [Isoalcanivorax indicus]|uniref:sulfite exporter TauE/SafE family protein n=1 Tax=Isoalcanivorax indicus TaxID=2202653 RepID=UPI000DB9FC16|nr:sulfite exporter TauE/SafE family protein [Isoalcanivorax indicus]